MKTVTAKLGNMRKAVSWVVYPDGGHGRIVIQSEHRIASIDVDAKKAVLSKHCANGAYFLHLSGLAGATIVDVPADVVAAALAARPKTGDEVGPGVYVG